MDKSNVKMFPKIKILTNHPTTTGTKDNNSKTLFFILHHPFNLFVCLNSIKKQTIFKYLIIFCGGSG